MLGHPASLRDIGLLMPRSSKQSFHEVQVEEQNYMAQCLADLALSVVGLRLQRNMHMLCGWSARSVLFLSPDSDVVKTELGRLRRQLGNWVKVEGQSTIAKATKDICTRSQFRMVPVQQVCQSVSSNTNAISSEAEKCLQCKHRRLLSSQVTEDCFNRQKRQSTKHNIED